MIVERIGNKKVFKCGDRNDPGEKIAREKAKAEKDKASGAAKAETGKQAG